MFKLVATARSTGEKSENIRKGGKIPAVFYGLGKETVGVAVDTIEFKKVWRDAGESTPIKLSSEKGDSDVLIHDVQVDPITNEPIHADFLAIDMKKKIQVSIPLEFVGVSAAVKSGVGNLVKVLHEVEVEALPADLLQVIEVDISKLATLEDQIFVSDVVLKSGVSMITDSKEVVASIVAQVEEKEESAPVDLSSIEVEKKGKKEEDAAAPTEEAPAA